jgi:hypothetical protein
VGADPRSAPHILQGWFTGSRRIRPRPLLTYALIQLESGVSTGQVFQRLFSGSLVQVHGEGSEAYRGLQAQANGHPQR